MWERFPLDPSENRDIRAADSDRDVTAEELREAHADGRLDLGEYRERLDAAMEAKTLGEIADLLDDLAPYGASGSRRRRLAPAVTVPTPGTPRREAEAYWRRSAITVASNWLIVALITNAIWLWTSGSGYYWPLWPMIGLAFPVMGCLAGRSSMIESHTRRLERAERRGDHPRGHRPKGS